MPQKFKNLKFEDTIHCRFFSSSYATEDWEQLCDSMNKTIDIFSEGYIWNRDKFSVHFPLLQEENKSTVKHLSSVTCFGDNIEDEWFIVYLIYELSRQFDHVIIQVEDCDGSFLLIEAADFLPNWLNPDNADDRVFIYQSNLHIIPLELCSLDETMDVYASLQHITNNTGKTIACKNIQEALNKRISGYPQRIKDNMHSAIVNIPIELAAILKLRPALIAAITHAYCSHDFLEKNHLKNVNYMNCVNTKVTFTKYLYAMLMQTKSVKVVPQKHGTENNKKNTLGLKLTCGFNIIMSRNKCNMTDTQEYKKFIDNLNNVGYFKNNIPGSKDYQELLDKALKYFASNECSMDTYIRNEIFNLQSDEAYTTVLQNILQQNDTDLSEDDDDWMNISPEKLNDILTSRYGEKVNIKDEDVSSSQRITTTLTEFLKKSSDFEGIERPNDVIEDKIDFDCDQFASCVEKLLNLVTSNEDEDLSDENDYSDEDVEDKISQAIDEELKVKLCNIKTSDNGTIVNNLKQSIKEEGLSGPSSNVLKTIGINKTDLFDSDDDND